MTSPHGPRAAGGLGAEAALPGERYRAADKLHDRVALITGGDSGIGRAVAVLYAREGADVAIVYLPQEEEDAQETLRAVEAGGRNARFFPATSPKRRSATRSWSGSCRSWAT